MELAKAYAVLGVEDDTSLENARKAFDTWHHLYSISAPAVDWDGSDWTDSTSVLALHELEHLNDLEARLKNLT